MNYDNKMFGIFKTQEKRLVLKVFKVWFYVSILRLNLYISGPETYNIAKHVGNACNVR